MHAYGNPIEGARVLDLFAGTGALGIEAISRGAKFALFVDEGSEARALLRENVHTLGLGGQIIQIDTATDTVVVRLGPGNPSNTYGPGQTARVVTEAVTDGDAPAAEPTTTTTTEEDGGA